MAKSPAVILFDSNGVAMAVEDGVAIPVGTQALLAAGSDGTDAHFLLVDSSGRPVVVGAGVAGTPAGGVVSIQGVAGGTAVPISGSITASNASIGSNNAAAPGSSTQVGGTDGTNLQAAHVFDADTGGGTQYVLGATLRKSASGGSVEAGTSSDPLRVDPTGTTTQPISATALPLPTGASTSANQTTLGSQTTKINDGTNTAAVKAASTPAIATDPALVVAISPNNSITANTPVDASPATQNITTADVATTTTVGANGQNIFTGTPTANSTASFVLSSWATVSVQVTGTWSGTLTIELSLDSGTTWYTRRVHQAGTDIQDNDFTANFSGTAVVGGYTNIRVRATAFTSGTAIVQVLESFNPSNVYVGNAIRVTDNAGNYLPAFDVAARKGFVAVTDGTNTATITGSNALKVDGSAVTQPVSAASLPLPTGAATASNQTTLGSQTTKINDGTNTVTVTGTNALKVDGSAVTQPVSGTVTANVGTTGGLALDATLTGGTQTSRITDGSNTAAVTVSSALKIDGSAVTQPVSAASLPLPTGASTSANQTTLGSQTTKINDGTNTAAVKAASTAALATDPALVVAISPNNTITTSNASVGTNNAALPASSTEIGGSDGTNLQAIRVFDGDTGAGTQYVLGSILRKSASGGTVEAGTASDPLRVDPTGTTTQPISAASLPLPTGAATEATLATRLADATFTARINTLGQKTSANSTPVVLASDQSAIPVTDNAGSLTVDTTQLPAALVGGRLDANVGAWLGSTAPTVGSKTSANSVPVVIASDQGAVPISAASLPLPTGAATASNQTTLGSQTTKINDGTNTATVKAASTAAVAADQALVVAISPNTAPIIQVNGSHANAWNAVAVGVGGNSNVIDCQYVSHITVFGNSSGNTTLSYQVSQDNSNFFTAATFTTGTGNFGADFTTGARYVRLQSNTARTITASICGKS